MYREKVIPSSVISSLSFRYLNFGQIWYGFCWFSTYSNETSTKVQKLLIELLRCCVNTMTSTLASLFCVHGTCFFQYHILPDNCFYVLSKVDLRCCLRCTLDLKWIARVW
jgi:hypothetical protein